MNASPFHLLVLFLLSTCHGEQQKKPETSLEVLCPKSTDIEPCECENNLGYLIMDCSMVQDEEQLRKVFSVFFPSTDFLRFYMYGNNGVKVLEDDVFGDVSFQMLDIQRSVLETVRSDALKSSLTTLTSINIANCQLTTFPFERLAKFTSLTYLNLFSNKIYSLPPLLSSSLTDLNLGLNPISHLSPDVFTLLPAIEEINFWENHLTDITPGTFAGLPKLSLIILSKNKFSSLQSSTFDLSSRGTIYLEHNNIDFVEVDVFKGVQEYSSIVLRNNSITTLDEKVWRPVLEKAMHVNILENPLSCDCDVAWLLRDSQLNMFGRCAADGMYLTNLNPADFDHCV